MNWKDKLNKIYKNPTTIKSISQANLREYISFVETGEFNQNALSETVVGENYNKAEILFSNGFFNQNVRSKPSPNSNMSGIYSKEDLTIFFISKIHKNGELTNIFEKDFISDDAKLIKYAFKEAGYDNEWVYKNEKLVKIYYKSLEKTGDQSRLYKYLGEYFIDAVDLTERVYELSANQNGAKKSTVILEMLDDGDLYSETNAETPIQVGRFNKVFIRSKKVRDAVLTKYATNGCEYCSNKTFEKFSDRTFYYEVHHIDFLANGGKDNEQNSIVLCPNCHRAAHHSWEREKLKKDYKEIVKLR